jgi:hypothetical protein
VQRQLGAQRGDLGLAQGQVGLDDIMSQLRYQQVAGEAAQVGGRSQATGQLLTGLLQGGAMVAGAVNGGRGNSGGGGGGNQS